MKDCTTCKYGFVDEQLGFPMCHHPKRFFEDCVDFNMHEEKEEPKKATGIEEKNLPDGLEEAADKQAFIESPYSWESQPGTFGSTPLFLMSNIRSAFKAGAEWEAEHTKQKPELVQHPAISYMYNADAGRGEQMKQAIIALLKSDLIQVAGRGFTKTELIEWVKTRPAEIKEEQK